MQRSTVYLQRISDGEMVEAELCDEITEDQMVQWDTLWVPRMVEAVQRNIRRQLPREKWPEDLHWNWQNKIARRRELLGTRGLSLMCNKELQGLMIVDLTKGAKLPNQRGKPIVYIEYLATAPWNRSQIVEQPVYCGVGRAMVLAAIKLSRSEEFRGRIGLHSLPQSEKFYLSKCGMTPVGKDPSKEQLLYFEMTEEQATQFER